MKHQIQPVPGSTVSIYSTRLLNDLLTLHIECIAQSSEFIARLRCRWEYSVIVLIELNLQLSAAFDRQHGARVYRRPVEHRVSRAVDQRVSRFIHETSIFLFMFTGRWRYTPRDYSCATSSPQARRLRATLVGCRWRSGKTPIPGKHNEFACSRRKFGYHQHRFCF